MKTNNTYKSYYLKKNTQQFILIENSINMKITKINRNIYVKKT